MLDKEEVKSFQEESVIDFGIILGKKKNIY